MNVAFVRSNFFVLVAFILALLSALVAGSVITSPDLQWTWLLAGSAASFYLSALVP